MTGQNRNRIRSFHAPEKPGGLRLLSKSPSYPAISRKGAGSFSRKRFSDTKSRFGAADNQKRQPQPAETLSLPSVGENIRIIPLGGVEEIGKNMTVIEIGNDILVVDAGFQFRDEDTPGIDYI